MEECLEGAAGICCEGLCSSCLLFCCPSREGDKECCPTSSETPQRFVLMGVVFVVVGFLLAVGCGVGLYFSVEKNAGDDVTVALAILITASLVLILLGLCFCCFLARRKGRGESVMERLTNAEAAQV